MSFKRYMVFGSYDYYPSGGLSDVVDSFNDLDDAKACAFSTQRTMMAQLFDRVEGNELAIFEGPESVAAPRASSSIPITAIAPADHQLKGMYLDLNLRKS